MKRTISLLFLMLVLGAGKGDAQGLEARATIRIEARVVNGLDTPNNATMVERAAAAAPTMVVRNVGGVSGAGGVMLSDMRALEQSLRDVESAEPGTVVTMMILGPDGEVLQRLTGSSELPSWAFDPASFDTNQAVRQDGSGYFLYINISACNV